MSKPLALVTGASSGIGRELAAICAREKASICWSPPMSRRLTSGTRSSARGAACIASRSTSRRGRRRPLCGRRGRPVDALLANAGHGLGKAFLDQDFDEVRHVIDTNITGTIS